MPSVVKKNIQTTANWYDKVGGGKSREKIPQFSNWRVGKLKFRNDYNEFSSGGLNIMVQTSPPSHPPLLLLPTAVLKPQEALAQPPPTTDSLESEEKTVEEHYKTIVQVCWDDYKGQMDPIEKDWCDWATISRPYSTLRDCLEQNAEDFGLGFPNPWAERIIFETHQIHFANCSLVQPTFSDPPEDVLLAMIIAPICLIPILITLVVWRSKDSEAQA
ncbi:receptor activity-modifying protein 2 [Carlito syrichta]|uniref:Receptor activity-modifying protein 2 n=1 Tax=Carlito syrichta TaxID=1868482 RepID=A0A1U7U8M9_CARSF|nr:receptor activity-modifying protein 2 [Carlito syrichta]